MSSRNITCEVDRFAKSIEELVGDIPKSCNDKVGDAVAKSTRRGAKQLRDVYTDGIGKHPWSKEYRKGFTSKVNKGQLTTEGVVGNRTKPGLVHLLENGHATLTGRRTRKYPHMSPAFEDMKEDFSKRVDEALRRL